MTILVAGQLLAAVVLVSVTEIKPAQLAFSVHFNPLKGRGVNRLHLAIQV